MTADQLKAFTTDLRKHLDICRELFAVVERESQALRQSGTTTTAEFQRKKNLLPALEETLNSIRQHRVEWLRRTPEQRSNQAEVGPLLREIQDLIMRIIVLDRENEQALLRKGLIPARHLPHANRQRPHYVADLYRRQSPVSGS